MSIRVMHLEPDQAEREHFRETLAGSRYRVVAEPTSESEALTALEDARPDIVVMPGPLLVDAPPALLFHHPADNAPPRALATYTPGEEHRSKEALRAGAAAVITTDYTRTALLEALCRLEQSVPERFQTRRRRVRLDVDLTCWVKRPEDGLFTKMKPAIVVDLSGTGAKLQVDEDLPAGAVVRLRIAIPNAPKPISATAQVAWHEPIPEANTAIVGLRFTQMSAPERQDLEAFIEHLLSRDK